MQNNKLICLLWVLLLTGAGQRSAYAQKSMTDDPVTVKALFIYNFTKYIEWPSSKSGTPFIIQVHGDQEMKYMLENMLKGRKVNDRPIVVRMYNSKDTTSAQINYIPARQYDQVIHLISSKKLKGSLAITDGLNGRKTEGINLLKIDDKLRFQINEEALRKEGLKISVQLLDLAVSDEEGL